MRTLLVATSATVVLPLMVGAEQLSDWEFPAIQVHPVHKGEDDEAVQRLIEDGRLLFNTKFNVIDGAGRPLATGDSKPTPRQARVDVPLNRVAGPDAGACQSCHNEPSVGGSGDAVANVFVGAQFSDPPVLTIAAEVTNERNTVTTFGAGLIEILASEITDDLQRQRAEGLGRAKAEGTSIPIHLRSKGIEFGSVIAHPDGYVDYNGLTHLDYDLVVKPFGIKGVATSIREFTLGALNHHHGIQAIERFGWERTGLSDFDGDGKENEFSIGQVTAMTLFQAALPPPVPQFSSSPSSAARERRGERLFEEIGCATCHIPALPLRSAMYLEPNKYNRPGAATPAYIDSLRVDLSGYLDSTVSLGYTLRAYTDLRRHDMCDESVRTLCNEERKQDNVGLELFMTQKLWDLATSAPYCHRGDCSTISEAILAHGGEGRVARDRFVGLNTSDKRVLISFLETLGRGTRVDVGVVGVGKASDVNLGRKAAN